MKHYIIRNEDCRKTMQYMIRKGIKVDYVITSPPYNNSKKSRTQKSVDNMEVKYKLYDDSKPFDEYVDFIVTVMNSTNKCLNVNGIILLNLSYANSIELGNSAGRMIELLAEIEKKTEYCIADIICWKKKNAIPNNRSKNKCTRICEYIFVICRKNEYSTYKSNKKIINISGKIKKVVSYSNIFNYFEARNNDGKNPYNNATYSVEMVHNLLQMYVEDGAIVYDPFAGTCTTALACKKESRGISCICSEIDKEQCEYGKERLRNG